VGNVMERVTGSKSLAVAAIVSLIIHGGILLAYALVFKDAGALTTSEPLRVALILPAELEKTAPLPAPLAINEKTRFGTENPREPEIPVDVAKILEEAPPQGGRKTLAAKAASEATALQAKDQGARNLAPVSPADQHFRPGSEAAASPTPSVVTASSPDTGSSARIIPATTTEHGSNVPVNQYVIASRGEMSTPGYAQLETFRGGAPTFAAPRYSENYLPVYPLPARQRGYAGVVMLSVEVLADGSVGRLEMKKTSGYDLLDKSARVTVKGWKFSPAKKMGTPFTMWVDVPVKFELN
jgi:TonB family protein